MAVIHSDEWYVEEKRVNLDRKSGLLLVNENLEQCDWVGREEERESIT